uniref:SAYSvFN domain-containing protein 1 n=1 Tax=Geotrypetes seraphini TaxID=260995 RepID=A0A6P8R4J8_GEOSA|nr:SAYSvFN domain-containing protein 1 [Geotrypetes seraphini]XP_033794954.1 SAYSvFN domain-containing protein 1 [Geotrypetes seraphini]XP_033794955.1 SAYSvFN domain-containing protein 1 [Geotrypetes seraphini]
MMEQRLAEFRARKKRAEMEAGKGGKLGSLSLETAEEAKGLITVFKEKLQILGGRRTEEPQASGVAAETRSNQQSPVDLPRSRRSSSGDGFTAHPVLSQWLLQINPLILKFLLWLVLLGLFVELEFGLVYFVLSMFYWIYEGTRSPRERKMGEKSAYSVFNPGCEAIQGTLTAEQFERELQYRPMAVS